MSGLKLPTWFGSSVLNTLAQLVRMGCGLIVIKMIVIALGATGMGKLGYFMTIISMLVIFAGGGVTNGIIKYAAEFSSECNMMKIFMSQAISYSILWSLIIAIIFAVFSRTLSVYFFGVADWHAEFMLIGFAQFGFALINFINGIVNGLRETKVYSFIVISGSILGAIPAYWLTKHWGGTGAIVALIFIQLGMLLPALPIIFSIFKRYNFTISSFSWQTPNCKLAQYSLMQFFSVAMMAVTEISIRNLIVKNLGWESAGVWQGVTRLSYAYIALFTSFLAAYYMPTLSVTYSAKAALNYVIKNLAVISCLFLVCAVSVFTLRNHVFAVVLSKDFLISSHDLVYQLTGDFFRLLSYVIGFYAVAKANSKICILLELMQAALVVSVAYCLFTLIEFKNVYFSYMVAYFSYFLVSIAGLFVFYRKNVLNLGVSDFE